MTGTTTATLNLRLVIRERNKPEIETTPAAPEEGQDHSE